MHLRHLTFLALAAAAAGCAPNTTPVTKKAYDGKPPVGTAMTFDDADELDVAGDGIGDGWWWIPFDGSTSAEEKAYCGDGSTTGLAVSPGAGPDLLVFFDGGGACWSRSTCEVLRTAVDDAFDRSTFEAELRGFVPSSITARAWLPAALDAPTIVFVPYCTGDVHGGDAVVDYGIFPIEHLWWHTGHANVMAYLRRLKATFPTVRKLVVAGSSAGGFGALLNYEALRWYWPDAQGYLIDDSGPALVGGDVPASLRDAWYNAWQLGVATDPFCLDCRTDLSAAFRELADGHREDRLAFLSHLRDGVMSAFIADAGTISDPATLLQLGDNFDANVRRLESEVFAATTNACVFYEAGSSHMMLTPVDALGATDYAGSHYVGALTLRTWLERLLSDVPETKDAWGSVIQ